MGMESRGIIGNARAGMADGSELALRMGRTGEQMVSDTHGRFYESAFRGTLFSAGMTLTTIANATFTTGTLGATCTPIVGLWNPINSGKNLVVLQVRVQLVNTALQMTGAGALMWATSTFQSAITTGILPFNRLSLAAIGSVGKGFANTALTGLSGNLTVQEAAGLATHLSNLSTLQTAAGLMPVMPQSLDNVDGAIIVPPGGIIALLCTTTPVAVSAASSILWEETPV